MVFTREQLKEWMPIFQAFIDGKRIQEWNGILEFNNTEIKETLNGLPVYDGDKPEESWIDITGIQSIDTLCISHGYNVIKNPQDWFRILDESALKFDGSVCGVEE